LGKIDKTKGKSLVEGACKWLLENQYPEGGWPACVPRTGRSWGRVNDKYPMYPYFTYMALVALASVVDCYQDIKSAIAKGVEWLVSVQRPDGGFPVYEGEDTSDVTSTAYAVLGLFLAGPDEDAIKVEGVI